MRFALPLFLILASVCSYALEDPEVDVAKVLGAEVVAFLKDAKELKACCLDSETGKEKSYDERVIGKDRTQAIVLTILNNDTWSNIKLLCKPRPGYSLKISDGSTYADLRVCLECGIVELNYKSSKPKSNRYVELTFRESKEFVKWIRETFPNDARLNKKE